MSHGNKRPPAACIVSVLALVALAPIATAEVLFVDRFDDSNTATACEPFTGNDCSLRGAIIVANANGEDDEIWLLKEGTYILSLDGHGTGLGDLDITDNLVINGWARDTMIIDASGISSGERVFDIYSGVAVTMRNFWIKGRNVPPLVTSGGGIWNSGFLTLEQCYVSRSKASIHGGGIYNSSTGWLELDKSYVFNNHADNSGGGIYNKGTLVVTDSFVSSGSAWGDGGGLFNKLAATAVLTRSTFWFNKVVDPSPGGTPAGYLTGGGIYNEGSVNATNCTFYSNKALDNVGGAIFNNGDLDLRNVTFLDNQSPQGSAIYNNVAGEVDLVNTLISGTCASDPAWFTSWGGNIESPGSTCPLDQSSDQSVPDPMIGSGSFSGGLTLSFALLPGSPAIDSGINVLGPIEDQRGRLRPIDGNGDTIETCDSGSYEYNPAEIFLDGFEIGHTEFWF